MLFSFCYRLIIQINFLFSLFLPQDYNQGRMTPAKFFTPHTCAAFGPGGRLIHVLPNRPADGQTATVEIINVEDILSDQKEAEEFHNFPGPLIRLAIIRQWLVLFTLLTCAILSLSLLLSHFGCFVLHQVYVGVTYR